MTSWCKVWHTEEWLREYKEKYGKTIEQPHFSEFGWLPDPAYGRVYAAETEEGRYYVANEKTGKWNRVPRSQFEKRIWWSHLKVGETSREELLRVFNGNLEPFIRGGTPFGGSKWRGSLVVRRGYEILQAGTETGPWNAVIIEELL